MERPVVEIAWPPRNTSERLNQRLIDNPLKRYDDGLVDPGSHTTELERYVQQFAEQSDLLDQYDLLLKGARLARDHQSAVQRYSSVLSGPELDLLDEKNELSRGFWNQSKFFRATIVAASLGAMINGWTQSANNGTAYGMPKDFGLHVTKTGPDDVPPVSHLWMFGMLMAIPWLSAGVFGTFLADPLQENLLADAAGIFCGCLANLLVVHFADEGWRSWRILTNTVLIPTIPLLSIIYLMPESPRYLMKHGRYRQALESFLQLQVTQLLASRDFILTHAQLDLESRVLNDMSSGVVRLSEWSQHSSNAAVSSDPMPRGQTLPVEMTALDNVAPQRENLQWPNNDHEPSRPVDASVKSGVIGASKEPDLEKALRAIRARNNPYSYHIGVAGYFNRLAQLWRVKRCRRALVCAVVAMLSQILTGVNVIAMLGTIVWEDLLLPPPSEPPIKVATNERYNAKIAAILGLAFGAANYVGGLPAYWLSDRIGRSIMLAIGLPNMAWSMLVLALFFQIDESTHRFTQLTPQPHPHARLSTSAVDQTPYTDALNDDWSLLGMAWPAYFPTDTSLLEDISLP
ncbi:hypothetical protein E8E11_004853 [Didymella keratinophila]|nr:hypothetical protein E8E11_004853 [Didymella keratinophila]